MVVFAREIHTGAFHAGRVSIDDSFGLCISRALLAQKTAPPADSPNLLLPPSEDVLRTWNVVGGKLIDMAQNFPEANYDFKVQ
jgi:hypothetical protein